MPNLAHPLLQPQLKPNINLYYLWFLQVRWIKSCTFLIKIFRATVVCTSIACLIFKVVIFSWESVLLRYSYILTIFYIVGHYFSKKNFWEKFTNIQFRFHNKHHLFRDHIIIQLNYEKLENNECDLLYDFSIILKHRSFRVLKIIGSERVLR